MSLSHENLGLPKHRTPAADLTEDEKFSLAVAAGAPYETWFQNGVLRYRITVPTGFSDLDDGGYAIAIGSVYIARERT